MFSAAGACFRTQHEGCRMLIFDGSGEQETLREITVLGHASTDVDVYMTIRGRRSTYRRFLESKGV